MSKLTNPPIPMVMAHLPRDADLIPSLGCRRVLNPFDHVEDHELCGVPPTYLLTDSWCVSVLCVAHAAEFRTLRPEWVSTMSTL